MERCLSEVESSARCRVLVLKSVAGEFCRGMDLGEIIQCPVESLRERLTAFARCLARLKTLRACVISLVDGEALGGGVGLAAAADCTIATSRAVFSLPEAVAGLFPAIIMPLLYERMTRQKVHWMAISGEKLGAPEARQAGLVDHLVSDREEMERKMNQIVRQVLRVHPGSVETIKRCPSSQDVNPISQAMESGAGQLAEALSDKHIRNAIQAFLGGESFPWQEKPESRQTSP
ncbi:MAG: hypothetical protein COV67_00435 [Nitrospinae bacterium CG11_big_fil_rev_8_21_14_0_20_56_8]|nr:MAG: hypothetical protein COV67_00435 [Nitrospinae bacterium CG11_big_fil_rev_8_21_14_0_20_56_8]